MTCMQIRTLIVARTTETNRAEIEIESSQEKNNEQQPESPLNVLPPQGKAVQTPSKLRTSPQSLKLLHAKDP
jgi:hypothetical protein